MYHEISGKVKDPKEMEKLYGPVDPPVVPSEKSACKTLFNSKCPLLDCKSWAFDYIGPSSLKYN